MLQGFIGEIGEPRWRTWLVSRKRMNRPMRESQRFQQWLTCCFATHKSIFGWLEFDENNLRAILNSSIIQVWYYKKKIKSNMKKRNEIDFKKIFIDTYSCSSKNKQMWSILLIEMYYLYLLIQSVKNDRYKLKIRLRGHTLKCYLCTLLGTSKRNIDPKIWSDS